MDDIQDLIARYQAGPDELTQRVANLSATVLDAVPIEGMWSIRQVVGHLADAEIVYADRLRRVIAEDNPTLFDADPNFYVARLRYESKNIGEELGVISAIRASTARMLAARPVEDFQRTGVHSTEGPMTLEALLERIVEHLPHHLQFIDQKLAALEAT